MENNPESCESLYWTPVAYIILYSRYASIKINKKFKKRASLKEFSRTLPKNSKGINNIPKIKQLSQVPRKFPSPRLKTRCISPNIQHYTYTTYLFFIYQECYKLKNKKQFNGNVTRWLSQEVSLTGILLIPSCLVDSCGQCHERIFSSLAIPTRTIPPKPLDSVSVKQDKYSWSYSLALNSNSFSKWNQGKLFKKCLMNLLFGLYSTT